MRSMEERKAVARRFGELVTRLAREKGIATEPGAGGRKKLAKDLGINVSMVSRALDGEVLPQMPQFAKWARVLDYPLRNLLVETGVVSPDDWPEGGTPVVPSVTTPAQPLTPEAAADAWQITNPIIRRGLIASIESALAMQAEENARSGTNGGAAARG